MHRLLLLISLFFTTLANAQNATVRGICTDRTGKPLELVTVSSRKANPNFTETDSTGRYELNFEKSGPVTIRFNTGIETIDTNIIVQRGGTYLEIKFSFQSQAGAQVNYQVKDPFEIPTLPPVDFANVPGFRGVEGFLVYSAVGLVSNNELTTNYNVRGGSYDENLVYVNGFQVYRPFLTRSGQQEGMSFLYSSLVKSVQFSAGGFDSQYGDKLSSVLDITYKTPDSTHGSLVTSLLGVEAHIEQAPSPRFNYLIGARYRSNGYLLNSLPTKGAYNPVFYDAQFLTNFSITENLTWSVLGHYSSNNYRFIPQTSRTDFGTASEAFAFVVFYDGQEQTRFRTMMGGTSLKWKASKKTNLDFYATAFNTDEREYFDIEGQYFINELETDPSKEEFGDSIATLGIGSFLDHARNRLNATILNVYHNGDHTFFKGFKNEDRTQFQRHQLKWGVNAQVEDFSDRLSEWGLVDSAGYSLPQPTDPDKLVLHEVIKGDLSLRAQRYTGFVQMNSTWSNNKKNNVVTVRKKYKDEKGRKFEKSFTDTIRESPSKWTLSFGGRTGYTTSNNEFYVTPRAAVTYSPRAYMVKDNKVIRREVLLRFATGLYYQPPFYREFRTFTGQLDLGIRAQKSFHAVAGTDVYFNMWNREAPFKFTAEVFYKHLWDVNPYEIENVRTRYYTTNDARAYAYGLDLNVNGQFIEGIESFFKVGLLSTKEDILNDYYMEYYNAAGEKIIFGISEDQTVVDSARIEPGYVPRPTDQLFTFGALIQDRMPKYESFTVQVGIQYASPLPYGPPDFQRYKDTLRLKAYFRVDLGMSYDFLYKYKYKYKGKGKKNFFTKNFDDAILSFEVFNLLGINNVLSKQWIQDTQGRFYAIPNFLTQRRFNLKLILRF